MVAYATVTAVYQGSPLAHQSSANDDFIKHWGGVPRVAGALPPFVVASAREILRLTAYVQLKHVHPADTLAAVACAEKT